MEEIGELHSINKIQVGIVSCLEVQILFSERKGQKHDELKFVLFHFVFVVLGIELRLSLLVTSSFLEQNTQHYDSKEERYILIHTF